ncbi:MAG: hypothetical protein WCF88_18975 [Candidatus Acidiferrales bacterium]|jgi:hypothetical protein
MSESYDIFRDLEESGPIWIEAVHGLESAKARVAELLATRPGNYFIYDPLAAKVIASAFKSAQMQVPVTLAGRCHQY